MLVYKEQRAKGSQFTVVPPYSQAQGTGDIREYAESTNTENPHLRLTPPRLKNIRYRSIIIKNTSDNAFYTIY